MGIKDKSSKRKLRRWSFAIDVAGKSFHIPVVAYGDRKRAHIIAARVKDDYSAIDSLKDKEFNVEPIAHETVSPATVNQLDGMELEVKLMATALEMLADKYVSGDKDNKAESIGVAIQDARAKLMKSHFPEGSQILKQLEPDDKIDLDAISKELSNG